MDTEGTSATAGAEAANLPNLDVKEAVDETEAIPETQSSQPRADDDMDIVTNARSSVAEEGVVLPSNDEAPPRDDEVTHLVNDPRH